MQVGVMLRAPWREPIAVLSGFAEQPWTLGFLSDGSGPRARWSYLATAPDAVLQLDHADPADPFEALKHFAGPPCETLPDGPPFQGGIAGFAAYELGDQVESLGLRRAAPWPDLAVARYPAILGFDHHTKAVVAVGRGTTRAHAERQARRALSWLRAPPRPVRADALADGLIGSCGRRYEAEVAAVIDQIRAGDIFQANIARSWTCRLRAKVTPFDLLARLSAQSPAPFAAYLRLEHLAVVSNSPERFLSVDAGGRVETRPIKGTRPRAESLAEDTELAEALVTSPKDRAENLMIVDLMRNDLARVCVAGSVSVPALWALESFTNVHHLVSTLVGRLAHGKTAVDIMRAAFPPGSVTGAPKVQAMRTIAGLEAPRGPYCGAMFWLGFDGALDSNILIRTAACVADDHGWQVEARAGAGIVADSDPRAERLETEAKISALARALYGALA